MNEHLTPMIAREAGLDEPQVESGRYLNAIWRSRYLIAGIAVAVAVAVAVVSLLLTSTYEARATVLLSNESSDSEVQRRQLATLDEFIVSSRVLSDAASELDLSKEELEDKVDSSVDPEANLIDVIASSEDPEQAAEIANTVVASFIDLPETIAPEKQLFENAEPPKDAASPKPLRNGVLALFAALFVGVLVALARDQFRPRIISTRDLSRLTGLSVLASIPEARWSTARRRRLITAVEDEAYRTLAAEVQLALPPEDRHLILVTSATHGEGKTTVTARLGQALAESGQDVLVIDGGRAFMSCSTFPASQVWPESSSQLRMAPP
jgi:succinoglycan biosynthesis transport protein ExoP